MLLCISVLAGIYFTYEKPNKENEIIILVDVSDSNKDVMDKKDDFIQEVIDESSARFKMGIVTFGYNQVYAAPLTYETSTLFSVYKSAELPDCTATDVANALLFAKDKFSNPAVGKIVLLSDGIETDDDANGIIKSIAAEGVKVNTVYFENETISREVQIINAEKPDYTIDVGDKFNMMVTMQSSYQGDATVTLIDNDLAGTPVNVKLLNGTINIEVEHTFLVPGLHKMEFLVESVDDEIQLNNKFITYVNLETYDKLLIVERELDESTELTGILENDNITKVVSNDLEMMPKTIDELRVYDQVILVNVANADMPSGFVEILHSFVYDYGGGMFTIGGNKINEENEEVANMYSREDMANTLYQQMLPVQAIDYTPPVGVVVIIDRSGSMEATDPTTGRTKLELAMDGARSCLYALTERDYCGIMTLGDDFKEEIAPTPLTQMSKIEAAIDNIKLGGNTVFTGAIERAGQSLAALTRVEKRHIILVTDGMPADPLTQYGEKIKHNFENEITMSIVAVGVSTVAAMEMQTASEEYGHGRFYDIWDASSLPRIMREDLNVPEIEEIVYTPFNPKIATHTAAVSGILESDIPQLTGYYGTKIKDGATVVLRGEFVPIYAQWQYGKGTVGSFMCDLSGNWSAEFMASNTGARIVNNIVNGLFPMENIHPQEIELKVDEDNYTTNMSVFTEVAETEKIKVTVTGPIPEGEEEPFSKEIVADWTNYSRINFDVKTPGMYTILVQKIDSLGNVIAETKTYRAFSYSQEYDMFYNEEECKLFLDNLATNCNGAPITGAWEVFEDFVRSFIKEFDPKIIFIIISIVLFLLDIAVRKFKWKWLHEIFKERKIRRELAGNK